MLYGIEAAKGHLYCLDAATGQTAWADTTRLDRFGSIIDAGSLLLASSAKADLVVFKPSADAFMPLARCKVSDKPVYAHPIIAGKKIFIKDEENLSLLTLP